MQRVFLIFIMKSKAREIACIYTYVSNYIYYALNCTACIMAHKQYSLFPF